MLLFLQKGNDQSDLLSSFPRYRLNLQHLLMQSNNSKPEQILLSSPKLNTWGL